MKGSPVKLGIVIGLAVIGIITLATAFDFGGPAVPQGAVVVVAPSPATSEPTKSPKPKPSPDLVQGIHVGVYNGTKVTGEAAVVASKLEKQGYVVDEVLNTVDPMKTTIVYYVKPADEAAAQALASSQFTGATVEPVPDGVTVLDAAGNQVPPIKSAHLLVFVGDDYLSQ